ncbi:MAG: TIGR02206 family membrane protein [Planctomycetota bacterium]
MVLADWMTTFRPFGWMHLLAVIVCGSIMVGAMTLGRRWRSRPETVPTERRFRWIVALMMLAFQGGQQSYLLLPTNFDWRVSLPLHVCDLIAWTTPIALVTQWRPLRAMLYFWGIGLSTQAFFTPILLTGPAGAHFWFFWIGHLLIVGGALYDVFVLGFRPRLVDFLIGTGVSLAYVGLMVGVNIALGEHDTNYGFVANTKPDNPTIIDQLGPWPLRVLWLTLIGASGFAMIWLVWPLLDRLRGRSVDSAS